MLIDSEGVATTRLHGDVVVVSPAGELDLSSSAEFAEAVRRAIGEGAQTVVVDFIRVSFVDSAVLSALVAAVRHLAPRGGRVAVVCRDRNVLKVLQVTGVDRMLAVHPSFADAMAAEARPRTGIRQVDPRGGDSGAAPPPLKAA